MAAEDYSIRINVDSSSAQQAQRNLQNLNVTINITERELNNTSSAARSAAASLSGLASVAKIAATSIAAISFRQAVQEMATFETKMLQLKALTMANETQMRSMEKQARTLGATTAFSAQQAAEAQGVLASTGLKVNEIMAATPKILQLAAAGNLDLAKSAEISMSTMKGLGLALTDLGHINDVFAKVAADSAISVEQVGIAMGEAAPSMRSFGVSLETTAAAIGILKDNGIKVGSIGDGLKSMMGALANETKEHTEILDKHNLSYKDLNVEQLGLIKVLNNLKDAHFTAREAIKLFGLDAFNVTTILQNNTKALADSSGALTKTSGDAQKQSEILNQGLAKAWDAFKGSLSEAALQLGEAGTKFDDTGKASGSLKSELTDLIQEVTGVIAIYENLGDEFAKSNKLTKEQYDNLKNVAGALRSFGGAVEGVALLTAAIWGLRTAQLAFNAAAAMNPYIAGAAALAAGVGYTVDKMNQYNERQKGNLKEIKTLEEANLNVQKQQLAVKNLTAIGGSEKAIGIAKTQLEALKKQRDDLENTLKKPLGENISETNQWLDELNPKKTKNHSLSIDAPDDDKKTGSKTKLSAAQKELNKQQEEYNRLLEKFKGEDPFEKYAQSMSDLYRVQKDLSPESFLLNQQKIAAEFEKSTVDLNAYNQELAKHKKYLEDITDYNATIDELTRNKQRGAITPTEYSLGVAQANAGLMNKVTDKSIPVNQSAEVIDAKNIDESAKALTKLDDLAKKTTDSFKQIGDSGKMAFDGLLGGISAVAAAATNFGDVMEKLNENHADYAKNYEKFMSDSTKSEEDKAKAKIGFEKENAAYQSASFKAEISGARQIAGATAKLFSEKSAARKAFHAIEMGMSVIEMAMAAKKMIVDVAAGAANMFAQGGFAGFAGVAAMAAVMGGLGFAMSGSSKTVDNTTPATKATGTILGDNNATSNSIENIVNTLNDIHAQEYPELKAMADNFKGLDRNMYKLQQQMARATVNFTNMQAIGIPSQATGAKPLNPAGSPGMIAGGLVAGTAAGALGVGASAAAAVGLGGLSTAMTGAAIGTGAAVGAGSGMAGIMVGGAIIGLAGGLVLAGLTYGLGKILGIGKTKITQIGEGIVINSGKLLEDGMMTAIDAQTWRKDSAKTKGWFSSKTRIIETYGQLSDEIAGTLQGVSDSLTNGMLSVADNLNVLDVLMYKFTDVASRPFLKVDFFGKDGKRVEDTNKVLTDQINAWADRTAKNVFGILFGEYQKLNEGMMETVARLAIQVAGVKGAYTKLGFSLGETNLGLIHFSDTMAQIFQSSAKADDGLKNFIAGMNEVYEFATNQGQKSQLGFTKGEQALKDLGLNVDITDTAAVKAAMLQLSEMSAKTIADTTAAQESLRKLKEPVEAYNNPQLAVGTTMEELFTAIGGNRGDWEKEFGKDLNKASWRTSKWSKDYFEKLGAKWKPLADYFDSIDEVIQSAAAAGGSSIDLKTLNSQISDANAEIEVLGVLAAKQVDATQYLKENEKTISNLSALQDEYLKKTLSAEQFLKIERERIIKEQYDDLKINTADFANLSEITNAMIKAGFEGVTKETKITASQLQRFVWSLEETDKALKKLSEGGKYLMDFSRSIDAWIRNLRATQLGTPESQLKASQANFGEQMKLAQFGATAEIKRQALSGITGYADTYINALRNYYASSEEGVNAIEQVIKEVSGLEKGLSIQELQLNELQAIKDAIDSSTIEIPKGINENLYKSIIESVKQAGDFAKSNPTVENQLKYDAFASIVLAIDKSAKSGADAEFLNKMISSIGGKDELFANIKLVINSAEFSASQKESIINGVLADFNRQINFDVAKSFETEIERVNNAWLKVELPTTTTDIAKTSVTGLSGGLKDLNGQYDVVIVKTGVAGEKIVDFSNIANKTKFGLDADSVANTVAGFKQITDSALAAKAAMNDLSMSQSQQPQPDYTYGGNLEAQAVNAGYSGDYTDTVAMESFLEQASAFKPQWMKDTSEKYYDAFVKTQDEFDFRSKQGWQFSHYAKGGIAHTASIFGEAGAEAAVPLPDGRTIPVTLSRDSANDNGETVAELKEISRKQEVMINTLIAAAQESRKQNAALVTEIEGLRTDTRLRRAA